MNWGTCASCSEDTALLLGQAGQENFEAPGLQEDRDTDDAFCDTGDVTVKFVTDADSVAREWGGLGKLTGRHALCLESGEDLGSSLADTL